MLGIQVWSWAQDYYKNGQVECVLWKVIDHLRHQTSRISVLGMTTLTPFKPEQLFLILSCTSKYFELVHMEEFSLALHRELNHMSMKL